MEGDDEREQYPGQHADVHQREPFDLQRRRVLDTRGGHEVGTQLLEDLAEVLGALRGPCGECRGLHVGDHRADAVLAQRLDRGGDRPVVPDEQRRVDEHRGHVTLEPEVGSARIGRREVVERDVRRVIDEDV